METNCQNCKKDFTIGPDDLGFYEKMKVPPPTFCPDCRLQRRLAQRNERGLHRRKCDAPGHTEEVIAIYSPTSKTVVYDPDYWWSDAWDCTASGRDYDFSKPFFEQYKELMSEAPLISLFDSNSVDSKFCNVTVEHKNCYMVSAGWNNEDSMFCNRVSYCKNTQDSYVCHKTEFGYENVGCKDSYQLFYSQDSESCNDSYFLYDCRNCSNCTCCTGLRSKQYCIFNQQYTKEEYMKKLADMDLSRYETVEMLKNRLKEMYLKALHRYANVYKCENVIGDNIEDSKNCDHCFDLAGNAENAKYCNWGTYGLKDSYDTGPGTGGRSELTYEGVSIGVNNSDCAFGTIVWYSNDTRYSFNCHSCHHTFGCVSLKSKQYCILNKQYTKEEYEALLPKVIEHMNAMPYIDKKGRVYKFGEHFPPEISPFSYNDTVAQDFFPIDQKTAEENCYPWTEPEEKNHRITKKAEDLESSIKNVPDSIVDEVVECAHKGECKHQCPGAYKIIPSELEFYRKFNLPLPRLCFNCRHYERVAKKNPMKLWHRKCQCAGTNSENGTYKNLSEHNHGPSPCPNEFETPYSPDRQEIVYCEHCYQTETA